MRWTRLSFGLPKRAWSPAFEEALDAIPADLEMLGHGLNGHVLKQAMKSVAFEGVGEASVGCGEADGGLADGAAVAAAEPRHRQAEFDRLAADGHGAEGAFFGSVADDVGRLTVRASVVPLLLTQVEGDGPIVAGSLNDLVGAEAEGAIEQPMMTCPCSGDGVSYRGLIRHAPRFCQPSSTMFPDEPLRIARFSHRSGMRWRWANAIRGRKHSSSPRIRSRRLPRIR